MEVVGRRHVLQCMISPCERLMMMMMCVEVTGRRQGSIHHDQTDRGSPVLRKNNDVQHRGGSTEGAGSGVGCECCRKSHG